MLKAQWGTKTAAEYAALPFVESYWKGGTTTIETADIDGWMVSITPSGGSPRYIAGRTGVGLGHRLESFVFDPKMNPFNIIEPGKRPRVTLTPTLVLKDGHPFMAIGKRGGDFQEQGMLQLFLNVVHFGMNVQEAAEAPKFRSYQMHSSFVTHAANPGRLQLDTRIPQEVADKLATMDYDVQIATPGKYERPRGELPAHLAAILFDWKHQTLMGGASFSGERYGISW